MISQLNPFTRWLFFDFLCSPIASLFFPFTPPIPSPWFRFGTFFSFLTLISDAFRFRLFPTKVRTHPFGPFFPFDAPGPLLPRVHLRSTSPRNLSLLYLFTKGSSLASLILSPARPLWFDKSFFVLPVCCLQAIFLKVVVSSISFLPALRPNLFSPGPPPGSPRQYKAKPPPGFPVALHSSGIASPSFVQCSFSFPCAPLLLFFFYWVPLCSVLSQPRIVLPNPLLVTVATKM